MSSCRHDEPRQAAGNPPYPRAHAGGITEPLRFPAGAGTGRNRSDVRGKRPAEGAVLRRSTRRSGTVNADPIYTVAEDSGLVIDALNGEPGVQSARFLRPDASYPERFAEILPAAGRPPVRVADRPLRRAVTVVHESAVIFETTATVEGEIAWKRRGDAGFGYDPIFYYPPYGSTLAEVTDDEKQRVAHRGQAFRQLARMAGEVQNGEQRVVLRSITQNLAAGG